MAQQDLACDLYRARHTGCQLRQLQRTLACIIRKDAESEKNGSTLLWQQLFTGPFPCRRRRRSSFLFPRSCFERGAA